MDCNNYYNYSVCTYSSWQMPTIIMWPFKNNMCSWNYKVTRDLRQLWQRQQKQHKKQLVLWPKQQLHTWIMLFSTFLWRPLHDYDVKPPKATLNGGRGHTTTNFPFSISTWIKPMWIQLQEKSPTFDELSGPR